MTARTPSLALLAALCAANALAVAQDPRPLAFTNARLVPVSGPAIERGTLVVRNGKIEALGADTAVPAGARVIDATGLTILPGLVSAWSRAGLGGGGPARMDDGGRRGGRRGQPMPMPEMGGGVQNRAATKVVDGLYARQEVFGELLRAGVTSLALTPGGAGLPGLGAVLQPDGKTVAQLTLDDDAFVQIGMARDAQAKKLLKESFEKAQKLVEERKKPPEPPKPAEPPAGQKPPEGKPGEAKTEPPKGDTPPNPAPGPNPQPTPPKPEEKKDGPPPQGQGQPAQAPPRREPPKDPNLEVLADLLEGKRRAIVQIDSAADLLHWQQAVPEAVKFPRAIAVTRHDPTSGTVDALLDGFKALQAPLLLPPDLSTLPRSRFLIHPARALHEAGVEIGFLVGDNPATVRQLFFRLMELVRCGLPADVALRGVTLVPAKALGIDARTGSLEPGKSADLLVFDGDPLQPTTTLRHVWLQGREIPLQP